MTEADVIHLPTPERLRRNEIEREEKQIQDADGNIGAPFRFIDTLRTMEAKGTITSQMRIAGEKFRDDFDRAQFHGIKAADYTRVPGCGTGREIITHRKMAASSRVWDAIRLLGGLTSPSGQIAWQVIGEQKDIRVWSQNGGWNGYNLHHQRAVGLLIGVLGALEAFYDKIKQNSLDERYEQSY